MGRNKGEGAKPAPTACLDCGATLERYISGRRRSYCKDCTAIRVNITRRRQAAREGKLKDATTKEVRDLLELDARIENNAIDAEAEKAAVARRKKERQAAKERKVRAAAAKRLRREEERRAREIAQELYPEEFRRKQREASRKAQARNKGRKLIRLAKEAPCTDCGQEFHPEVMDFDHVRGEKWKNVSKIDRASEKKVREELAKCDLVCANCHRIRTANRRRSD